MTTTQPTDTMAQSAPAGSAQEPDATEPGSGLALLRAELALTLVTATLAVSFARLFRSASFVPRLLLVVVVAHGLAAVARRRKMPLLASIPLLALAAVLLFSWLYLPHALNFVVPSGQTFSQARTALDGAFSPFRRLVPPVPITTGFEITMAIGLWVLATFADAAAFSGDAPVQALVPHAAAFLGSSIFARGRHDIAAAAALAGATLIFFAAHRAVQASKRHWVQLEQKRGAAALFGTGAGLAVVAVLAATLIAPHLPGVDDKPVVDLRSIGKSPGPIEVGNPLVGVGAMLGAQSNQLFFTIKSPKKHYWRLTSLEEYDGSTQEWKTRRSYRDADSGQPLPGAPTTATTETDEVKLSGLPGIWLPTPYEPKEVTAGIDLRYDAGSSSVIAAGRQTLPDVSYEVQASIPADNVPADARRDTNVDPVYLQVPRVDPYVSEVLKLATQGATTDMGKLLKLQNYFHGTFGYSPTVNYSEAADPTVAFLKAQSGFCQQFSSTFALMARLLGIPSRVAVGFTYGTPEGAADAQGRTTYAVRGRQAHAWPEVHLTGVGWVAFEPTPGRGNPDATQYSGLGVGQDGGSSSNGTSATTTTQATGQSPATTVPSSGKIKLDPANLPSGKKTSTASTSGGAGRVALIAALVLAALVLAALAGRALQVTLRRRRRRGRGDTPSGRVRAAWITTCDWLELAAVRPVKSETPTEFGRRAANALPVETLAVLARLETERLFGDQPLSDASADDAEAVAQQVRVAVIERTDRRHRLAHLMGWERRN